MTTIFLYFQVSRLIKVLRAGKLSYGDGLKLQNGIATLHYDNLQNSKMENHDSLILLEHHPVYTVGLRRNDYGEQEIEALKKTGAEFFYTNRGGLITFHGPGQLVVYPIINLKHFTSSMKWYICHLEKTVIDLCGTFGLEAATSPHTGVWIGDNKICAIGVHGSRFITTHGLALNCNVDLDWYKHIIPCGIKDKGVTSLTRELKNDVSVESVLQTFIESFSKIFNCQCVEYKSS